MFSTRGLVWGRVVPHPAFTDIWYIVCGYFHIRVGFSLRACVAVVEVAAGNILDFWNLL